MNHSTKRHITRRSVSALADRLRDNDKIESVHRFVTRRPFLTSILLCLFYLLIFQRGFVFSGDIWAEAFYEYVHGAIANGWQGFFHTGIAGYFNFLPKLFAYTYIQANLPVQYIDYFFRFVVIVYTIISVSYIAHRHNRYLIRNDYLRLILAITSLMTYYHVSSFSFINVWYVGFIPIILVSLNPNRFKGELQEVGYAIYAMSVCLTKPSVLVLPLVLYRAIKLKEYLLGFIVSFAIFLQTALFFTSSYYYTTNVHAHIGLIKKLVNTCLYIGLMGLKLFKIHPVNIGIVLLACVLIAALLGVAFRRLGRVKGALITLTLFLAGYSAIYAPDAPPVAIKDSYKALFYDQMKLQRELIISFLVLLLLSLALSSFIELRRIASMQAIRRYGVIGCLILVGFVGIYRHIDTLSSGVYINIDPFRKSLQSNTLICMPIPPTSSWVPYDFPKTAAAYSWYYENGSYGMCSKTNYDKAIRYTSFTNHIGNGVKLNVASQGRQVSSLLIPLDIPATNQSHSFVLTDLTTGQRYFTSVPKKPRADALTFLAFNLTGDAPQKKYTYSLKELGNNASNARSGSFIDGSLANYAYFLQ